MPEPTAPQGSTTASQRVEAHVRTALADRYRVEHQIGEGGMATVFLAEDLKHGRKVAIKVLHETLTHTIGIRRFLQEIEVIARLQHPHLLTLIDSGDVGGLPYYIMPYVEAQSLREVLATEKQLTVERAVGIAREVADGLAYAHQHGVVHRDIKPANILMSGGHAVVVDFGIATALQNAAVARLTETGISLGSPTYMSPEQAAGERELDERTDVYSVACVLYEMLSGEAPIDGLPMQEIVTRKLTGTIRKLRERRPDVPVALEAAVHRALSVRREDRFASIQEFSSAIAHAIEAPVRLPRRALWVGVAAAVVLLVGAGNWYRESRRVVRATQQVGEINRLASRGQFAAAFQLAESVLPIIPRDSTLRRIRPIFTDFLPIVTAPAGARVFRQPLHQPGSAWEPIGVTPLDSVPMPKLGWDLTYRLRIERAGYETVEVLPHLFARWAPGAVPIDTLRLDRAGELPGMVRIPGWSAPDPQRRGDTIHYADYHIDRYEITNREYQQFVTAGGYEKREYWTEPFIRDGRELTWDEARAEFRDRTGLPGPSTWSRGSFPADQEDFPVGGVSYYEAAAYARFAGKRLPTMTHWQRAAARYSREASWIFMPTSNLNGTHPRPVGQGVINPLGLYDVAGNVREWCVNPVDNGRLTRGAGWEEDEFRWGHLVGTPEFDRSPSNGIRLMAVSDPDSTIARLSSRIRRRVPRDYSVPARLSDAEFRIYQGMFDYDRRPLQAQTDTGGISDLYRWEKVSFTAGYGGERMAAYVFLPKAAEPPYELVIYWPHGGAPGQRFFDPQQFSFENLLAFIPQSGRALVLPLFKGTYERDDSVFSITITTPDSTTYYRDLAVQWIKDLRRTVDYLESRSDMAADRLGFYGVSWGAQIAPLALALEPRIKAAVLNVAGYAQFAAARPEVEAANYAQRVRAPTLMLNGKHDTVFPYETSQVPFFQQLGTPAEHKKHQVYATAHSVPQDALIRETLAWFDRYLTAREQHDRRDR